MFGNISEYIDKYATEDIIRRMDRGERTKETTRDGDNTDSTVSEYTSEDMSDDESDFFMDT